MNTFSHCQYYTINGKVQIYKDLHMMICFVQRSQMRLRRMKAQESQNQSSSQEPISASTLPQPPWQTRDSSQRWTSTLSGGRPADILRLDWPLSSMADPHTRRLQRTVGGHSHSVEVSKVDKVQPLVQWKPGKTSTISKFCFWKLWDCWYWTLPGVMPYRQSRRSTRQMTVSGDSTISYSSRRTFSFGGGMSQIKYSRRLPRQMTVSGDSGYSSRPYRSVTKLFGRALSTTLTLNSMDGSNSTILLEDWRL